MFTEIQIFLTSAVVALFVTLVISALQIAGIINVKVARVFLFIAWVVAVLGASASLNNAPLSHRVITAIIVGISVGLILIIIERLIVRAVQKQNQTLIPETATKEKPEPNIVCLGGDDLFVTLDRHEIFRETDYHGPGALRSVAVKFANEPKMGHKVAGIENVRAQIIFYDFSWPEQEYQRVDYGCWLNEESPYVSFNLSDNSIHRLVIGVFQNKKDGMSGFERDFKIYGNSPDRNAPLSRFSIENNGFWIKVRLIVGEHGEYSSEHHFLLHVEPGQHHFLEHLTDEEKKAWRETAAQHLNGYIKTGEEFLIKPVINSGNYYSDTHTWRDDVSAWLTKTFGLQVSWRFYGVVDIEKLKKFPRDIPGGRNQVLDEFYTQLLSLKEINEDYKSGKIVLPFDF